MDLNRNRKKIRNWERKILHGQYLRQTKEVRSKDSCVWLQRGELKGKQKVQFWLLKTSVFEQI